MAKLQVTVNAPDAGRRLDRYVQAELGDVPSSLVQRLLRQGKVRLNGARGRSGDRIATGDVVEIHHTPRAGDRPRALNSGAPLTAPPGAVAAAAPPVRSARPARGGAGRGPTVTLLCRDAQYVVVDKPAGLPCHGADDRRGSVLAWVQAQLRADIAAQTVRPVLAHRVDIGTSGVVVVALTAAAATRFQRNLAAGLVHKKYLAAVWGRPEADELRLDTRLERVEGVGRRQPKVRPADGSRGRRALTLCRVVARADAAALLAAVPVTGRTHQIRAHLRAAGLPIVGDPRYGDPARDCAAGIPDVLDRPLLHAQRIAFPGADGPLVAHAPLPADARSALRLLALPEPRLDED